MITRTGSCEFTITFWTGNGSLNGLNRSLRVFLHSEFINGMMGISLPRYDQFLMGYGHKVTFDLPGSNVEKAKDFAF